jgi:hypothetical protein
MKVRFHMLMTTDVVDDQQSIKSPLHEFEISHYAKRYDFFRGVAALQRSVKFAPLVGVKSPLSLSDWYTLDPHNVSKVNMLAVCC